MNTPSYKQWAWLAALGLAPLLAGCPVVEPSSFGQGARNAIVVNTAFDGDAAVAAVDLDTLEIHNSILGLSGSDLARRAVTQAKRFGVEILTPQAVSNIRIEEDYRIVTLENGDELNCHAVILGLGVSWRRLTVPGIENDYGIFHNVNPLLCEHACGLEN